MNAPVELEQWPDRLQSVIQARCRLVKRAIVLRETDSTQDAARRLNAQPGDVVVALRQTHGRGRLGRAWADTAEQGVALTMAIDRAPPERLAIASAIGAARAMETLLKRRAGVKWPNDIMMDGRKLAGILIEQTDALALIGVGVNVLQTNWPHELAHRAVSLAQLNVHVDRLDAIQEVVACMDDALHMDETRLENEFAARDMLSGKHASFRSGGMAIAGTVVRVDPFRGLMVRAVPHAEDIWLPAASTTIVEWS